MRIFDFTPMWWPTIGFDRFVDLGAAAERSGRAENYPPATSNSSPRTGTEYRWRRPVSHLTMARVGAKCRSRPADTMWARGKAALVVYALLLLLVGPAVQAGAEGDARNNQQPIGFADIAERVKPSVISVSVRIGGKETRQSRLKGDLPTAPGDPFEDFFRRFGLPPAGNGPVRGEGSGFFISADGNAVTNNHVVNGADKVEVTTDDGKTYPAKIIGTDPRTDLALIKVEGPGSFPFAKLSDNTPRIGDWVLAVGNPFGLGGTVTAGIVSAVGRDIGTGPYDDFIQIDAAVNKGNSGGPSFNTDGEVIGVNTAIYSPSGGSVGVAFSIPASTVRAVIDQLKEHGIVRRGWIGVNIQSLTQDVAESIGLKTAEGAIVAQVQTNGPAAKAGIETGDVITAVNGRQVRDSRELARTIASTEPGTSVKLHVRRKGQDKDVDLILGGLPDKLEAGSDDGDSGTGEIPQLGLTVAPARSVAGAGKEGLVVTEVDPTSTAAERGLKEGDVILEVAGKPVVDLFEAREAISKARGENKSSVVMKIRRSGASRFVAIPIGKV